MKTTPFYSQEDNPNPFRPISSFTRRYSKPFQTNFIIHKKIFQTLSDQFHHSQEDIPNPFRPISDQFHHSQEDIPNPFRPFRPNPFNFIIHKKIIQTLSKPFQTNFIIHKKIFQTLSDQFHHSQEDNPNPFRPISSFTRRYSKPFQTNFIIHKKIFQTLSDQFHRSAFETIRRDGSKLRTYALFRNEIGPEIYLQNMKNPAVRSQVTKFRLSNQSLMIELGRHRKIPKELRFCQFCPNKVETEAHLRIHCPPYLRYGIECLGKSVY